MQTKKQVRPYISSRAFPFEWLNFKSSNYFCTELEQFCCSPSAALALYGTAGRGMFTAPHRTTLHRKLEAFAKETFTAINVREDILSVVEAVVGFQEEVLRF